ncbi:TonB-dependent receptor [Paramagnetospirillum caucaseum]|uniref:TonB-dependent receptor n=1 Tax=Paramagnetospirillum caucaseum TaxID=1244869 RepID=M2ZSC9_9PROT|nr:TonB-dependent receptor [Paramagnetospirillum caucaseum]EME70252.1 TonB-dependent receptor [Paramagnetospirillum caucaseum]
MPAQFSRRALLCAGTALCSILALASNPAPAADDSGDITEVVVTDKLQKSKLNPNAAEAKAAIRETAGGVDSVSAEEFRDGRTQTVKDMLDFVPGVFAQAKWGEDSRLSIRGSGLAQSAHTRGVKLMQDGVPFNAADGFTDLQQIDPLSVEHVDVWKGGNALRYGAAMLGGAINMTSFTGHTASPAQARLELGSFGYRRAQISSGMALGAWDYYISPTRLQSGGYRNHSGTDSNRLTANTGYRFANGAETRIYVNLNDIRQELNSSLTMAQFRANPKMAGDNRNFSNNTKRDIQSMRFGNKTAFQVADWEMEAGIYGAYKNLFHPLTTTVIDQVSEDMGTFVRGTHEHSLFGLRNQLTLGGNYAWGHTDAKTFGIINGTRGTLTGKSQQQAQNIEFYGEDRLYLTPAVSLIAAGQGLIADRNATDQFLSNGNSSGYRTFTAFNPKVGAMWQPSPDLQVFGNLSRAVEPPIISDLNPSGLTGNFAPLDPQESVTLELGTRGNHKGWGWDAVAYRSWMKHELQRFTLSDNNTYTVNADRTIHQGVELGLSVPLAQGLFTGSDSEKLVWRNSYTLNHFTFDGDRQYGDNELPGVPLHYYRGEVRYTHPSGAYFGPNLEWAPQSYHIDNANTARTIGYHLWGVKTGWDVNEHLSIFADARNLADRAYIAQVNVLPTMGTSGTISPGEGRAVYMGVNVKW